MTVARRKPKGMSDIVAEDAEGYIAEALIGHWMKHGTEYANRDHYEGVAIKMLAPRRYVDWWRRTLGRNQDNDEFMARWNYVNPARIAPPIDKDSDATDPSFVTDETLSETEETFIPIIDRMDPQTPRERRIVNIMTLYAAGWGLREIGEMIGVSESRVSLLMTEGRHLAKQRGAF